ncbi:hypothetical protein D3C84_1084860 [compost metagenome]
MRQKCTIDVNSLAEVVDIGVRLWNRHAGRDHIDEIAYGVQQIDIHPWRVREADDDIRPLCHP